MSRAGGRVEVGGLNKRKLIESLYRFRFNFIFILFTVRRRGAGRAQKFQFQEPLAVRGLAG